jgi:TP901 family phage tail tape measure protein
LGLGPIVSMVPLWAAMEQHPALAEGFKSVPLNAIGWDAEAASRMSEGISQQYGEAPPPAAPGGGGGPSGGGPRRPGTPGAPPPERPDDDGGEEPPEPPRRRPRRRLSDLGRMVARESGLVTKVPSIDKFAPIPNWDYDKNGGVGGPAEQLIKPIAGASTLKDLETKDKALYRKHVDGLRVRVQAQKKLRAAYETMIANTGEYIDPFTQLPTHGEDTGLSYVRSYGGQRHPGMGGEVIDVDNDPRARQWVNGGRMSQAEERIARAQTIAGSHSVRAGIDPESASQLAGFIAAKAEAAGQKTYMHAAGHPDDGGMGLSYATASRLGDKARDEEMAKLSKTYLPQDERHGVRGHLQSMVEAHGSTDVGDFILRRGLQSASWGLSGALVYGLASHAHKAFEESLFIQRAQVSLANLAPGGGASLLSGVGGLASKYGVRPEEAYHIAFRMQGYFGNGPGASAKDPKSIDATMKATTATLLLAKTATIELSEAMGDLIAVTDSFGGGANTMMKTVDGLVSLQKNWGANIEQTVAALARLADLFHEFNIKEPLAAGIVSAIQQKTGESGIQIASKLERVLPNVNDPTVQANITRLGVHYGLFDRKIFMSDKGVDLDRLFNSVGSAYTKGQLKEGDLTRLALAFGGTRNSREFLAMFTGWAGVKKREADFASAGGDAQSRWNQLQRTAIERLRQMEAAIHNLAVAFMSSGVLSMLGVFAALLRRVAEAGTLVIGTFNHAFDSLGKLGTVVRGLIGASVVAAGASRFMNSPKLIGERRILGSLYGDRTIQGMPVSRLTMREYSDLKRGTASLLPGTFLPGHIGADRAELLAAHMAWREAQAARAGLGLPAADLTGGARFAVNSAGEASLIPFPPAKGIKKLGAGGASVAAGAAEFGGGFIKGLMLPAVLAFTVATKLMTKAMEYAAAKIAASSLGAGGGLFGGKVSGGLKGLARLAGMGEDATALGGLGVVAGGAVAIGAIVAGGVKISRYNAQMAEKRRQDIADYEDAMRALRAQAESQATPDEKASFAPADLVQKYGLGKKIDIYQQARDAAVKHRGFWSKLGTGFLGTFNQGLENSLIGTSIPGMDVGDIDKQLKTDRATYRKQLENQYTQAKAAGLQWLAPEDLGFREQDMANQLQYGGPSYVSKALYSDSDPTKISMLMKKSKPTTTLKMVAQYTDDLNQMQDQINFDLQQGRIDDVKKLRQQYYDTLKNEKDLISASSQARAALRGFLETSGDAQREMVSYYNEELKRNPQWDKNSPQYQQNRLGMLQAQVAAFQGDSQNRNTALQTMSGFMVDLQEQSASLLNQANNSANLAANISNMGMRGSQSYLDAANQAGQAYSQYIETLYQNMVAQNNANFGLREARTTDPVKLAKLKEQNARANLEAVNQRDAMKRAGFQGSTGNPMLDQVLKDLRDVATTNKDVASTNKDAVGQFKSSVGAIGDKMGVGANRFVSGVDKFNRAVDRLLHKGTDRGGSGTSGDQFGPKHPHSWQQLMVGGNDLKDLKAGNPPDRLVLKTGKGQGGFQTFVSEGQTYVPGKGELYEYRVPGDKKHFFYVDPKTGKVFSTRKELPSQSKYGGGRGSSGPQPVDLGDYGWSEYDVPTGAYNSGGGLPKTSGGHWETHYDTDTGRKTTTWVPDPQTKKGRHGGKVTRSYSGGMSSFMAGVRQEEQGGRYDWNNKGNPNYHGAYQFGEPEWRAWAKGAGVNPNDHSKAAQDEVARWRMNQLAREFHGNYARVAAAWYAGEGGENRWWTTGYEGGSNPSISAYVNSVLGYAKRAANSGGGGGGGSSSGGGGGGKSVGIGEMGLFNPVAHIADKIDAKFGTKIISGYRAADAYGEHNTRTAFDIGIKNLQQGWEVARWAKRHADQIGLQWVIFDKHIWNPDRASEGWRGMPDRGSPTANHMDHVHIKIDPEWVTRHASSGGQSVDKQNAKAQVITAHRERRMAEIQQEVALLTLLNGPLSQGGQISAQIVGLRARVRFERNQGKNGNDTEIFNDLVQIQQLLYQAAQERINAWKLDMELMGDTSNKAQMLGLDAKALERQMHQYLKHGGKRSDAAYKEMRVQRRDALRDKALQQVQYGLTDEDFAFQMHQESWGQHVQHLIKLRDSINTKTRAGKELWQQINLEIQGLIDGLNQTFNIPTNITLPTLYQVRRSIAASNTGGAFGVSAMTNPITDVVGTPTYGITTGGSTGNKKVTNDAVTKTSSTQSDKLVNNSTTQVTLLQQIRNLLRGKGVRAGEQDHDDPTKDAPTQRHRRTTKPSTPDDGIIDWKEHEAILIAGERVRRRSTSPFANRGQLPKNPGPMGPGQRPTLTGPDDAGLDLIHFAIDWPGTKAKDRDAIHADQREVIGDRADVREDEHKLAYAKRHHASKKRIRELTRRLHHDQKELHADSRDLAAAWAKYHKDDKKAHSLTGWQRHMKNLIVGEDGKYTSPGGIPTKAPFPNHQGPHRRAAMDMISAMQATTGAPVTHINHTYNHESNIVINARGADAREVARLVTRALGSTLHTANRRNGSAPRRY